MSSWASGDWSDGGLDDEAATSAGALSPTNHTEEPPNNSNPAAAAPPPPPPPPPPAPLAPLQPPPHHHHQQIQQKRIIRKPVPSNKSGAVAAAAVAVGRSSAPPPPTVHRTSNPPPPVPTRLAAPGSNNIVSPAAPSSWGTSSYGVKLRGLSALAEPSPEDLARLWESAIQEPFVTIQIGSESPRRQYFKRNSATTKSTVDSKTPKDVEFSSRAKLRSRHTVAMTSPPRSLKNHRQRAVSGQSQPSANDTDGVETKEDESDLVSISITEIASDRPPFAVPYDALLDLFDRCTFYFLVSAADSDIFDRGAFPERVHVGRSDRVILSNKPSIAVCELKTLIKTFISHFQPDADHSHRIEVPVVQAASDNVTLVEGDLEVKTDVAYPASEADEDSDNASLQTSLSERSNGLSFREELSGMTIHPRMDLLAALAVYSVTITKKAFISNWRKTCSFVAWKRALHADELALPSNVMFLELNDRDLERIWHKSTTRSNCDQVSGIEADDLIRWALFRSFTDRAKVFKSLRGIQDSGRLYTISLDMLERFQMERWCRLHSYWTHMELLDVLVALVEFPEVHRRCGLNIRDICESMVGLSCSTIAFIICDYLDFADMVSTAASAYPSMAISNTLSKERFVRNFSAFLKDCVLS